MMGAESVCLQRGGEALRASRETGKGRGDRVMTDRITASMIEDRFEEAARTLRRLPNPPGSTPRGYSSSWPEYRHDPGQSYGYNETRVRVAPTPAAIKRMEECFEWLGWIDPEDARIVWLRAEGMRWRQIGIRMGCVRQTAWRRWVAALATIANHLNKNNKSQRVPSASKKVADKAAVKTAKGESATLL